MEQIYYVAKLYNIAVAVYTIRALQWIQQCVYLVIVRSYIGIAT